MSLFVFIGLIGIVSAVEFTPEEFFDNEWFYFALIFLLVFVAVYFFAGRSVLKDEKKIRTVVSIIIALYAATAIMKDDWIPSYSGEPNDAFLTVALIIGIVAFLWFVYKTLWGGGIHLRRRE